MSKRLKNSLFDEQDNEILKHFRLWKNKKSFVLPKDQEGQVKFQSKLFRRSKKQGNWKEKYYILIEGLLV